MTIRPDGRPDESLTISLIVSGDVAILGTQRAARTALADLRTRDVDPDAWLTDAQAIGLPGGQNLYVQPSQPGAVYHRMDRSRRWEIPR
ncbi:MAG: hypothetical protein HND48_26300 [Chloroflexi bacterium]|nr:hypothetical protein [Chloroflexota bacterium]